MLAGATLCCSLSAESILEWIVHFLDYQKHSMAQTTAITAQPKMMMMMGMGMGRDDQRTAVI